MQLYWKKSITCFSWLLRNLSKYIHCVKSVQIRSFFWSVFPCIRTEYGDLLRKSPYSVRVLENTDQKKLHIWTLFAQWYFAEHLWPAASKEVSYHGKLMNSNSTLTFISRILKVNESRDIVPNFLCQYLLFSFNS